MATGRAFIDTDSDPGAYADALRWHPWIEDRGDGNTFFNGAFLSPDTAFERLPYAGERSGDAAPFALTVRTPHSPTDIDERQ